MSNIDRDLEMLKSENPDRRYDACDDLRRAPSIPKEALTALRNATKDSDPYVVDAAMRALARHAVPSASSNQGEIENNADLIYENGDIRISKQYARFGQKGYLMTSIKAVEAQKVERRGLSTGLLAVLMFGLSLLFVFRWFFKSTEGGPDQGLYFCFPGMLCLGLALFFMMRPKYQWAVHLQTTTEESDAYTSDHQGMIEQAVEAIRKAKSKTRIPADQKKKTKAPSTAKKRTKPQ